MRERRQEGGTDWSVRYRSGDPFEASSFSGFVSGHPLARVFGGISVKLLSQVYWSPGLL